MRVGAVKPVSPHTTLERGAYKMSCSGPESSSAAMVLPAAAIAAIVERPARGVAAMRPRVPRQQSGSDRWGSEDPHLMQH